MQNNISKLIQSWWVPNVDISEPEDRIDGIIDIRETQLWAILANGQKRVGDIFIIEGISNEMEWSVASYARKRMQAMIATVIKDSWITDYYLAQKNNAIVVHLN